MGGNQPSYCGKCSVSLVRQPWPFSAIKQRCGLRAKLMWLRRVTGVRMGHLTNRGPSEGRVDFTLERSKSRTIEIVILVELLYKVVNLLTWKDLTKLFHKRFLNIAGRVLPIKMADNEIGKIG